MQIHKLIVSVLDFDELGADGVKQALEGASFPNRCITPDVRAIETRDIGEWSDDNPLNKNDTASAEFERLFAPAAPPVAAPGASIRDNADFRQWLAKFRTEPSAEGALKGLVAFADAHAAQHGKEQYRAGLAHTVQTIKNSNDTASIALKQRDAANARAEAAEAELEEWRFTNRVDELQRRYDRVEASLARLVEGVEGLTQWRSCIAEYNSGESLCKAETSWIGRRVVLHADLSALLPAKADKPKGCTGTPACCPDNEGYGCHCTPIQGDDHA